MTTEIGWTWVPDGRGGTKIGRTWNAQVGCKEISRACEKCYAAKLAHRGLSAQHKGLTVMRTNAAGEPLGVHWNGKINRVPKMLEQPLKWTKPSGIFVGSMTDTFFDVSTDDACRWIAALFGVMSAAPQHTFMLLTKRPENAAIFFAWLDAQAAAKVDRGTSPTLDHARQSIAWECARQYVDVKRLGDLRFAQERPWPLPNCWMGVTAEDQRRAEERIPVLLELPAVVRYVSFEPACSEVDFRPWLHGLDQIIAGGESGPGARASHPGWFRSARDQCEAAGVPYFHKQNGVWAEVGESANDTAGRPGALEWTHMVSRVTGHAYAAGEEMPIMQVPAMAFMRNVGKDAAGRELDGRTHDGFPKVAYHV
jgi:protein gp37